jgi:hypothetical protein
MPEAWRRAFEEFAARPAHPLLVLLLSLLVFSAAAWFVYATILKAPLEERAFFERIGEDSGLSRDEIRLLWRAARRVVPEDPVRIYLSPRLWAQAARDTRIPDDVRDRIGRRLHIP